MEYIATKTKFIKLLDEDLSRIEGAYHIHHFYEV